MAILPAVVLSSLVGPSGAGILALGWMGQELEISEHGLWFLVISSVALNLVVFASTLMAATSFSSLTFVIVGGIALILITLGATWYSVASNLSAGYHHIKLSFTNQWKLLIGLKTFWVTSAVSILEWMASVVLAYLTLIEFTVWGLMKLGAIQAGCRIMMILLSYLGLRTSWAQLHIQTIMMVLATLPGYFVVRGAATCWGGFLTAALVTGFSEVFYSLRSELVGLLAFQALPTRELVALWQILTVSLGGLLAFIL